MSAFNNNTRLGVDHPDLGSNFCIPHAIFIEVESMLGESDLTHVIAFPTRLDRVPIRFHLDQRRPDHMGHNKVVENPPA